VGTRRVVGGVVAGVAVLVAAAAGATLGAQRVDASTPALTPRLSAAPQWVAAPGTAPPITTPAQGSLAVDSVVGNTVDHLAAGEATATRPIASITKTMTALVVLELHPLVRGEAGPAVTVTRQDVQDYRSIAAAGGSVASVTLGEQLSERDILLGLMLPSANNLALTAARWVDGSVAAFVARLNARAAALGMAHTHFADPDGLDPATTSTAADLVILGRRALADDALVDIVSTTTATLPGGVVVANLDTLLSVEPGWIGIKTGWTPAAGGCLLFAARRMLAPRTPPVTVVGAVLGQPPDGSTSAAHPELGGAFRAARTAVEEAFAGYAAVVVQATSLPVAGTAFGPWGTATSLRVHPSGPALVVRLGEALTVTATPRPLATPSPAGSTGGTVTLAAAGTVMGSWSLVTDGALAGPSPWWRLLHG